MKIGEVCNREVIYVDRGASILEAARLMRRHHVGDVVVAEEKEGVRVPVGILTDRDIVVELLAEEVPLDTVTVGDVMTFDLLTAREEEELAPAIRQMKIRGVRRMPVVSKAGALVGILAADDLIEVIAEQLADLVKLIGVEQRREQERRD